MKSSNYDAILFKQWLIERKNLAESSVYVYFRSIERFLARNPNLEDLDDYNNFLVDVSVKKRCSHYYSAIKAFIEFRIGDAALKARLYKGLIKPKERKDIVRERKHLDENKILEVINYLDSEKHKVVALIQSLTGVRAGDILRLKVGGIVPEVYNKQDVLRLNILGKGKKRNVVYLFDEVAQEIVMDYITSNKNYGEFYFIETGKMNGRQGNLESEDAMLKMNYQWYWADLKQAIQTAGIDKDDFATHDFRRCFGRRVWEKWKDIYKLQKALNHSDPKVTMRYLEQSGLDTADIHYEMQK